MFLVSDAQTGSWHRWRKGIKVDRSPVLSSARNINAHFAASQNSRLGFPVWIRGPTRRHDASVWFCSAVLSRRLVWAVDQSQTLKLLGRYQRDIRSFQAFEAPPPPSFPPLFSPTVQMELLLSMLLLISQAEAPVYTCAAPVRCARGVNQGTRTDFWQT